jgi:hypothetical protein
MVTGRGVVGMIHVLYTFVGTAWELGIDVRRLALFATPGG